jgi:hypothetical protein
MAAPVAANADGIAGFSVKPNRPTIPTIPREITSATNTEPRISLVRRRRPGIRFMNRFVIIVLLLSYPFPMIFVGCPLS